MPTIRWALNLLGKLFGDRGYLSSHVKLLFETLGIWANYAYSFNPNS